MSTRFSILIALLFLGLLSCGGPADNAAEVAPSRSATANEHPATHTAAQSQVPTQSVPPSSTEPASDTQAAQQASFVFAAAGDHGANTNTTASLAALDQSGAAFYLALGDMDYDQTASDQAWCDYMLGGLPTLGPTFAFELIAGNHEEHGGPDGDILNHAACLPDRMNSSGVYAAEYHFDYPLSTPLVRVIMIAADLNVGGVTYDYALGNPHYNWLASAIDSARAGGIPWVIVGMHKNCISTGDKTCEIGTALMNLLVNKKVDLVFQGHDHTYQRGKQLAHRPGCTAVPVNSYDPDCVADDGSDGEYLKGAGSVLVVSGAFGRCCYQVNPNDSEAGDFAVISSASNGFSKFSVYPDHIDGEFVRSTGTLSDNFTITADADRDGFADGVEGSVGTSPQDPCGDYPSVGEPSGSWPADFVSGGGQVDSTDKVTLVDLTSFLAPARHFGTSTGDVAFDERWDVVPGPGLLEETINLQDFLELVVVKPPMFAGQRAFGGPVCTG